jgi:DNA-binding NtrC family response regulator
MQPIRVLLVDDEEELVSALVERMQLRGIDAEGLTKSGEALRRVEEKDFDVVVLDVKMPGMSGLETMRQLKASNPQLQFIFVTGHGSTVDSEEGMREGAFVYLEKPVSIEDLIEYVTAAAQHGKDGR